MESLYQKEISYNKLLPYSQCFEEEANSVLAEIKLNLGRAIALRELRPGGLHWCNRLFSFIRLYGHRFSKEDHLLFIKLVFELLIVADTDSQLLTGFSHLLLKLLKKRELLSRDDLIIPWKPLYKLFESISYSKLEPVGLKRHSCQLEDLVKQVIRAARVYFSDESTQEMLDEWRPLMCPFDITFAKAMQYFSLFLPTTIPQDKHEQGFKLWFDELVGFWDSCHNSPSWEQFCVKLFARVAKDNIGHIDWKSYLPKIFTRILRSFSLPIVIKSRSNVHFRDNYDAYVSAVWIVSMMGGDDGVQSHLHNFFDAVKSFYHPSNTGKYTTKLQQFLSRLSKVFTERVHRERYKKPSWENVIPEGVQLTDDNITKFVECLQPAAMLAMFNKLGSFEAAGCLQHLAQLKPDVVLPAMLERTYTALDTLTEPHQLTASLTCITSVARPLLSSSDTFPHGPTHLIRLLTLVLPGIDANDFRKAMATFTFISTLISLVPLVDCSQAPLTLKDLSETEKEICAASAQFEDFVLLFMERCFAMIENCQFHQTSELNSGVLSEKLDSQEGMIGMGLTSTFHTILMQCSPQIFQVALKHLYQFCSNKIFEAKVAGQMVADFARATARTDAKKSLKLFVPYIHSVVDNIMSVDGIQDEEEVDEELVWCLQLLSEVVRCNGVDLLPYKTEIVDVLKPCVHLKCKKAFHFAAKILHHVIPSLVLLYPLEWKCSPVDFGVPPEEHLFIKDWGKSSDVDEMNIQWHIPSTEENAFAKELLDSFLLPVLDELTQFTKGKTMTRDEVQHKVDLVHHILQGSCGVLSHFQGPVCENEVTTLVSRRRIRNTKKCGPEVFLGEISREKIGQTIHDLLDFVLKNSEDDTKTLFTIIKIYRALLLQYGVAQTEFDMRWKSANAVKKGMEDKLCHKKKHIRALLIERVQLQHELRVLDERSCEMTEMQELLIKDLFSLSTSVYTEVRIRAQKVMFSCFETFIYSARSLIPPTLEKLKPDPKVSHEAFKGALYVLANMRVLYLATHYWEVIEKVWLVVAQAEHSEKPSIIALINHITERITRRYDAVALSRTVSGDAVQVALSILNAIEPARLQLTSDDAAILPSQQEMENGEKVLQSKNETNLGHYHTLVQQLVGLVNSDDLRWRFSQICTKLLALLIRCDVTPPQCLVKLFTNNLVHDSLAIRKVAITTVGAILKLQKRPHVKVSIDPYAEAGVLQTENGAIQAGDRPDNYWLHYVKENLPRSEEQWNKCQFVDKTHWGYYTWPKKLLTYAPYTQQPVLDRRREDLTEGEREILDAFTNKEFVDKLISFLSLEDRKGRDKFNVKRFILFKGLFRNFGDTFLHLFQPHLDKLSGDSHESNQRCAAEIVAGLTRGCKHWTYNKLEKLWNIVVPVIQKALNNLSVETIRDWGTCMATAAESRDPRRIYRLLDVLMDDPLNGNGGAFADSSRLYVLQGALAQQEWRVAELLHDLLKYIEPKLGHSYKNVRDRLGSVTCNILMCDIKLARGTPSRSPRVVDFIKTALPQLCELKDVDMLPDKCRVVDDEGRPQQQLEQQNHGKMQEVDPLDCVELSNDLEMVALDTSMTSYKEDDKRKTAIKLSKTVLNWLWSSSSRSLESCPSELFELLPLIVPLESQEDDQELQDLCSMVLAHLSYCLLSSEALAQAVRTIKKISESPSWHSRKSILTFLQGLVCGNFFLVIADPVHVIDIQTIVLNLLGDKQLEVREAASQALSGLIHYGFFKVDKTLQEKFSKLAATPLPKRKKKQNDAGETDVPARFVERHAGVLGLASCILAFPYDVPEWMPQMLVEMGEHLHDPNPIQTTVKKVLSDFRRTHHDNWTSHKQQFSEDQLLIFTDLLVSPCYYA